MKIYNFYCLLLFFFLFFKSTAAQTINEIPPSFTEELSTPVVDIINIPLHKNLLKIRKEDELNASKKQPTRIAIGLSAKIEFNNREEEYIHTATSRIKIWRKVIKSEGAKGIIANFSEFFIPKGGTLYIYTSDRKQVQTYTHENNPQGNSFFTEILYQDEIVLEYYHSGVTAEQPRIKLLDIGYVYDIIDQTSCLISVNCMEGKDWQRHKNGVVQMLYRMSDGSFLACSGSLINNVRQDGTPYILTANHNFIGNNAATFTTMKVYFFKELFGEDCFYYYTRNPKTYRTGVEVIADIPIQGASDGTLLKLIETIPSDWDVYFNGWDATPQPASSGVCIHHPNALIKKISTFTKPAVNISHVVVDSNTTCGENSHWNIQWAATQNGHSTTFPGSSGSPLFNQNGHIVGTLTGGYSGCDSPLESDWFGKFSYHWNQYTDPAQHFRKYLDPDNTGTLILDGYDPHPVVLPNAPTALPATNVAENVFTANWEPVNNADKYYLDVYEKNYYGEYIYFRQYNMQDVGDLTAVQITNLQPNTIYKYVVTAGARNSLSAPSQAIYIQTARSASSIMSNGVTIGSDTEPVQGAILQLKEKEAINGGENASKGFALPRVNLKSKTDLYPMFDITPEAPTASPSNEYNDTVKKEEQDKLHVGLIVYNITDNETFCKGVYVWNGTLWDRMSATTCPAN